MASLPMLELGDVPPLSMAEFRGRCEGVLDAPELEALDALLAGEECDDEFVREYQSRETQMRNVSGRLRAQAWGPEVRFAERSFSGYDVTFAKMIQDAFMKSNPLEKEQDIDRARFWLVDSLADRRILSCILICNFCCSVLGSVINNKDLNLFSAHKQRIDALTHIVL